MPRPATRQELCDEIVTAFDRLYGELRGADSALGDMPCVDDWTVKDVLAIRLWWTRTVVDWVEKGRTGAIPVKPAPGYRWNETPRLNAEIVKMSKRRALHAIVTELRRQYRRLLATIDSLDDRELTHVGVYEWAGRYPVSRWLSVNTTRQYVTARKFIRRAKKRSGVQ